MKPNSIKRVFSALALAVFFSAPIHTGTAAADSFLEDLEMRAGATPVIDAGDQQSLSGSFLAGQVAASNNDESEAVERFKAASELDPENIDLKQSLFLALTANGEIPEAIGLLNTIPADNQDRSVNHVVAASDALKRKSWNRALQRIDKVTGTDLDTLLSQVVGSWAYFGTNDIDNALARLEKVSGPEWTKVLSDYHAGLILSAAGRDADAIPYLEEAVANRAVAAALTATYMRSVEALARAQARTGSTEQSLATISDGLQLVSSHEPLIALKEQISSGATIQPLLATAQQGAAEIFFNVGSAISRQGGLPFAQSHLQVAYFLNDKSDAILYALGNVFQGQNKFDRANEFYQKITEDSPYYRNAQLETALNLNQLENLDESVATFNGVIEKNPDDFLAVATLGSVYAQHKRFEDAADLFNKAIARIPNPQAEHWNLFYRRGVAFERTKQWDKAEPDFKKALELNPDQPDVLNYLGYSWVDQGVNLDEGLSMIRKAVTLRPNAGFIIDSLGWAYYRLGRYEEAVEELERALKLEPTDPVVNDHLGDAYWQVGRKLEAVFQWRHALANDPAEADKANIEVKLQKGLTN